MIVGVLNIQIRLELSELLLLILTFLSIPLVNFPPTLLRRLLELLFQELLERQLLTRLCVYASLIFSV